MSTYKLLQRILFAGILSLFILPINSEENIIIEKNSKNSIRHESSTVGNIHGSFGCILPRAFKVFSQVSLSVGMHFRMLTQTICISMSLAQ